MSSNKPNRTRDSLEFGLDPIPAPGLALECVRAREEPRLHSFLLLGTGGVPQCARGLDQVLGGEPLFFDRTRGATRH
jgi:hypothetical protein